jgi:hypothetical protein
VGSLTLPEMRPEPYGKNTKNIILPAGNNCSTLRQLMNLCPDKYQQYAAALIVVAKNFETSIKYNAIQFYYFIIGVSIVTVVVACVSNFNHSLIFWSS